MKLLCAMRLGLAFLAAGLLSKTAQADIVDFTTQPASTQPGPLSIGGITITGSNDITFRTTNPGLGILGNHDALIDGNEFARFTFDAGPATGVFLKSSIAFLLGGGNGLIGIEGFDAGGASLGTVSVNFLTPTSPAGLDVSSLFGNVPLSAFRFIGSLPDTGDNVSTIGFTPSGVPEPSTLALTVSLGLSGLAFACRRRSRKEPVGKDTSSILIKEKLS